MEQTKKTLPTPAEIARQAYDSIIAEMSANPKAYGTIPKMVYVWLDPLSPAAQEWVDDPHLFQKVNASGELQTAESIPICEFCSALQRPGHFVFQVDTRPETGPAEAFLEVHIGTACDGAPNSHLSQLGARAIADAFRNCGYDWQL